jgi:hypothetical protein
LEVDEAVLRRREAGNWIQLLIGDRPELFDDIMVYFFGEVIGKGRSIHAGPGAPGMLRDPAFLRLVEADPALCMLEEGELAEQLYERAEAIISQGLRHRAYPES